MKRKFKMIGLIIILCTIFIVPKSNAVLNSKPAPAKNASNVLVNTNVSNSYVICQDMTKSGESLYGTSVKPHLATNKDWGAVSYLSNSIYGTNTAGKDKGVEIEIGDDKIKYYSTNGNASGVMNWGSNPYKGLITQTAGIVNTYVNLSKENRIARTPYATVLADAADSGSEYVEVVANGQYGDFPKNISLGMALGETRAMSFGGVHSSSNATTAPTSYRGGLFSYVFGYDSYVVMNGSQVKNSGIEDPNITCRAVVWN